MLCKNCGAPVNDGSKFCGECGAVLVAETPVTDPEPQQSTAEPQPAPVETQSAPVEPQPASVAKEEKPKKAKKEKPLKAAKVKAPKKPKKGKKVALIVVPIVAVALIAGAVGGFFLLNSKNNKKTEEAKKSYTNLCDMTSLSAQSYLYARILTERLLETDLATADPEETEALFNECIAAWEATGSLSEDMLSMAEELDDSGDIEALEKDDSGNFLSKLFCGRIVNAASHDEDDMSELLTPSESVEQCTALAQHISVDATVCTAKVTQLHEVYNGRTTDYEEWDTIVEQTSACFTNVVFLSGEVIDGDCTFTSDGMPRSVHQISTEPKPGMTTIDNTDILIDVGSSSSTFVMSQNNRVSICSEEMASYMSHGSSSTISISTHTKTTTEVSMTFHRTSFTSWYVLDEVGGFTITRGDKEDDGLFTPPDIEPADIEPEPVSTSIVQWTPAIGVEDITYTRDIIIGEEVTIEETEVNITSETLVEQTEILNAGVGEITVSLIWSTHDDLDLHVTTPNGNTIYYGNRMADGGCLDIDMNASSYDLADFPVENIYFAEPMSGEYEFAVRDYRDRTPETSTYYIVRVQIGDEVEEYDGWIDGTGYEESIVETEYTYTSTTFTQTVITEETMDVLIEEYNYGIGDITISLMWDSWDDLDLHVLSPEGMIDYRNPVSDGGLLDYDANKSYDELSMSPVENIYYFLPSNGTYIISIQDYCDRTMERETNYLLRITVGDESFIFTGTIDGTGFWIDINDFEFDDATTLRQSSYVGHTYSYVSSQMTWAQARSFCESVGGHLVTINDAEEQQFLEARFPDTFGWIGFVNGSYDCGWITGEPVDYTNICASQPYNYDEMDLFGFMYDNMQWGFTYNDDVEYHYGFYIEWEYVVEGAVDGVLSEELLDEMLTYYNAGNGDITVSMIWDSPDDLDIHIFTPDGSEIYYGNRSAQNGVLDVDANTVSNMMDNPIENVYFTNPYNGEYWIYIHDYEDRTDYVTNFIIRITVGGESQTFTGTIDGTATTIEVLGFEFTGGLDEFTLDSVLDSVEAGTGEITVSMIWDSTDDLDLHILTPDGSEIYYGNRNAGGGELDIDANTSSNMMDPPIENIYFTVPDAGEYTVFIKDYSDRTEGTTNYIVRVTIGDESQTFTGTIDSSGTQIDITSFVYGGTPDGPDESTMDDVLNSLNAGTGEITISMLWDSTDDLDLYVENPDGSEICYYNRTAGGGELDIDANTSSSMMDNPVENVYYSDPAAGSYTVRIDDYNDRSSGVTNYIVRVTVGDQSQTFTGTIDGSETIDIITFTYG